MRGVNTLNSGGGGGEKEQDQAGLSGTVQPRGQVRVRQRRGVAERQRMPARNYQQSRSKRAIVGNGKPRNRPTVREARRGNRRNKSGKGAG